MKIKATMAKKQKTKVSVAVERKSIVVPKPKKEKLAKASPPGITPMKRGKNSTARLERQFVEKAVEKLFANAQEYKKNNKQELLDDANNINLQVTAGKITNSKLTHTLRFNLDHGVLSSEPDILLITPDLKNEKREDYEKNNDHYRALLDKHGITYIKDILSIHQLRAQYKEYEMQNRLMGLYDMFIVDQSVDGYFKSIVGQYVNKKKKFYGTVKLVKSNLKDAMDKVLKSTLMIIHGKGDSFNMQIGNTDMDQSQIVDNIMTVADQLAQKFPGGFNYIRNMLLKTPRSKSVQFYISNVNFSKMKAPTLKTSRPVVRGPVKGELSTDMDVGITVTPLGDVFMHKVKAEATSNSEQKSAGKKINPQMPLKKKNERAAKRKIKDGENSTGKKNQSGVKTEKKVKKEVEGSPEKKAKVVKTPEEAVNKAKMAAKKILKKQKVAKTVAVKTKATATKRPKQK